MAGYTIPTGPDLDIKDHQSGEAAQLAWLLAYRRGEGVRMPELAQRTINDLILERDKLRKQVDYQAHCSRELRAGLEKVSTERDKFKDQYDGAMIRVGKLQAKVDELEKELERERDGGYGGDW